MIPIVSQASQGIGAVMEVVLVSKIIPLLLIYLMLYRKEEIVSVNILWYLLKSLSNSKQNRL